MQETEIEKVRKKSINENESDVFDAEYLLSWIEESKKTEKRFFSIEKVVMIILVSVIYSVSMITFGILRKKTYDSLIKHDNSSFEICKK